MQDLHGATPRGTPFLSVDEQVFFIPPRGHIVTNRARKLLFFYEAECRHYVPQVETGFAPGQYRERLVGR